MRRLNVLNKGGVALLRSILGALTGWGRKRRGKLRKRRRGSRPVPKVVGYEVAIPAWRNCNELGSLALSGFEKQARYAIHTLHHHHTQRGASPKYHMPVERDLAILWSMHRRWKLRELKATGISLGTASTRRRNFREQPWLMFRLPLLHQGFSGKRTVWRCEVCKERMTVSERKSREHVASHFVLPEAIAANGVFPHDA